MGKVVLQWCGRVQETEAEHIVSCMHQQEGCLDAFAYAHGEGYATIAAYFDIPQNMSQNAVCDGARMVSVEKGICPLAGLKRHDGIRAATIETIKKEKRNDGTTFYQRTSGASHA